jgi:hypothetical protein
MARINGPKRHVNIRFRDGGRMQDMLHSTGGQAEYGHTNGEISTVRISTAGKGTRRGRSAKSHPDMSNGVLRTVVYRYGEVRNIQTETWSCLYRYPVRWPMALD